MFFLITEIDFITSKSLDGRIEHEIKHLQLSFKINNDSLIIASSAELNEKDLTDITDFPFFLQIFSSANKLAYQSKNMKYFTVLPPPKEIGQTDIEFEDIDLPTDRLRSGSLILFNEDSSNYYTLQLSSFNNEVDLYKNNIIMFNLLSLPIIVGVIIFVSLFIAKKSFDPISKIIELAQDISAKNLDQRIALNIDPSDKLAVLIESLNNLFDRLKIQFQQISQFTDNASHQLMTPLTAIYTELEYILRSNHPESEYKKTLLILKKQTERMIQIVKTLLILSKEEDKASFQKSIFSLNKLVKSQIEHLYKGKNVIFYLQPDLYLRGHQEYFSMAIQNLINNAIKYSPENSEVILKAERNGDSMLIFIIDQGMGITKDERSLVFDKFYRGQETSKTNIDGYGLGLSLVQRIIESMNGTIVIKDNSPKGTIFEIKLESVNFE